jgi:hypothetical protein
MDNVQHNFGLICYEFRIAWILEMGLHCGIDSTKFNPETRFMGMNTTQTYIKWVWWLILRQNKQQHYEILEEKEMKLEV